MNVTQHDDSAGAVSWSSVNFAGCPMPQLLPHLEADAAAAVGQADLARGRRLPAWLLSAVFHTAVIVVLALTVRILPRGAPGEPDRGVGVVLARSSRGETEYFDEAAHSARQATAPAEPSAAVDPLPDISEMPADLGGVLPAAGESLAGSGEIGSLLPSAEDLTQGGGSGSQTGGQARTQVFGLQGEGTKFFYVFDRSGSMSGYGGRPLRSAQRELIASLDDLDRIHQFQIIFYNEEPRVFSPDGRTPRLVWGDEQGKRLAQQFVRGIVAAGGTRHLEPLLMSLRLQPDVVFFLTDAEEPKLTAEELARIRRANKGTQIHAIEFGFGPSRGDDNFLKRLARQNGGGHAYVDISKLPE